MKMAFIKGEFNTKNYLYAFDLWRRKLVSLIFSAKQKRAFLHRVFSTPHMLQVIEDLSTSLVNLVRSLCLMVYNSSKSTQVNQTIKW
jgi:hypothetical protein